VALTVALTAVNVVGRGGPWFKPLKRSTEQPTVSTTDATVNIFPM